MNALPNKARSPIPSSRDVNEALDAIRQNKAAYGSGHFTTRGFLPILRRKRASSLPWSSYVRIAGRKVAITGTRSRYIWVNVTNNTAQWSSVDMDPMPDGIEIYDTYVNEVHIPRLG